MTRGENEITNLHSTTTFTETTRLNRAKSRLSSLFENWQNWIHQATLFRPTTFANLCLRLIQRAILYKARVETGHHIANEVPLSAETVRSNVPAVTFGLGMGTIRDTRTSRITRREPSVKKVSKRRYIPVSTLTHCRIEGFRSPQRCPKSLSCRGLQMVASTRDK